MEFLLEPLEMGHELDLLLSSSTQAITCSKGYVCDTGTADPAPK